MIGIDNSCYGVFGVVRLWFVCWSFLVVACLLAVASVVFVPLWRFSWFLVTLFFATMFMVFPKLPESRRIKTYFVIADIVIFGGGLLLLCWKARRSTAGKALKSTAVARKSTALEASRSAAGKMGFDS